MALLERRLPPEIADAVAGDLAAEYADRLRQGRTRVSTDLWFWVQVCTLRAGRLRRAAGRLATVRPTYERTGPGRVSSTPTSGLPGHLPVSWHDLKYALRRLLKTPGFTAVAILSLALGIGANTAMFSIVNAVLIRALPVEDEASLVEVYSSSSDGFEYATTSHPDFLDLRAETDAFSNVVGTRSFIGRIDVQDARKVVFGELVSWDYFQTLGVPMALGRSFLEEEDRTPGTHPVLVLGHRSWVQDYGQDPDIVGTTVRLNGRPFTVVGVAPSAFTGSMPVLVSALYTPLMMTDVLMGGTQLERRRSRNMFVKGRLAPGTTIEQANEQLRALSAALEERYPDSNTNRVMSALPSGGVSIHPVVDGMLTPVASLLLGVVGIVLLIACANLASFLLARAEDRRQEIAIRLALGAGRRRLVGQLLVETTVLAVAGGLVGVVLADWTIGMILSLKPPLPVPVAMEISLDRTVLAFTAGVSVLAGLAFGLLPALQATRPDLVPALKNDGSSSRRRRVTVRDALVVTQLAFSLVLLVGAGLFVRSLKNAQGIDPGFDTGAGALMWPMPELSGYDTPEAMAVLYDQLEARLLADPRVTGVALADRLPLGSGVQTGGFILPGVPSETPDGDHDLDNTNVNPGYFDAMGVEIVSGRAFTADEVEGDGVVVVSEAFGTRYYPGEDVVGRTIEAAGGRRFRIIGVAANTKVRTLGEEPRPYVYQLAGQIPGLGYQFVVRGSASSEELVGIARSVLDEVAPDMVLFEEIKTMDEHLALLLFPPRMAASVLSVFGALALLLAAVGIYGVVSYAVSRRTRELGIRMSLGATSRDVVSMAVGGGMRLVLIGSLIGIALSAAVTWAASGYLFGVSARDLSTFLAIPLMLAVVALASAWVPARRASRVDPVTALRAE